MCTVCQNVVTLSVSYPEQLPINQALHRANYPSQRRIAILPSWYGLLQAHHMPCTFSLTNKRLQTGSCNSISQPRKTLPSFYLNAVLLSFSPVLSWAIGFHYVKRWLRPRDAMVPSVRISDALQFGIICIIDANLARRATNFLRRRSVYSTQHIEMEWLTR
jgi:hypothetical protein